MAGADLLIAMVAAVSETIDRDRFEIISAERRWENGLMHVRIV